MTAGGSSRASDSQNYNLHFVKQLQSLGYSPAATLLPRRDRFTNGSRRTEAPLTSCSSYTGSGLIDSRPPRETRKFMRKKSTNFQGQDWVPKTESAPIKAEMSITKMMKKVEREAALLDGRSIKAEEVDVKPFARLNSTAEDYPSYTSVEGPSEDITKSFVSQSVSPSSSNSSAVQAEPPSPSPSPRNQNRHSRRPELREQREMSMNDLEKMWESHKAFARAGTCETKRKGKPRPVTPENDLKFFQETDASASDEQGDDDRRCTPKSGRNHETNSSLLDLLRLSSSPTKPPKSPVAKSNFPLSGAAISLTPPSSPHKVSASVRHLFKSIVIPGFFLGPATGARTLRRRLKWVLSTAEDLYKIEHKNASDLNARQLAEEVVVYSGRTKTWWRNNLTFYEQESELNLSDFASFVPFLFPKEIESEDSFCEPEPTCANYYAYIHHYKLCHHDVESCDFFQALLLHYSRRNVAGKPALPEFANLENSDENRGAEWEKWKNWWIATAQQNRWSMQAGFDAEHRQRIRSLQRRASVSPRKRKYSEMPDFS